jgi:hypothetical protein
MAAVAYPLRCIIIIFHIAVARASTPPILVGDSLTLAPVLNSPNVPSRAAACSIWRTPPRSRPILEANRGLGSTWRLVALAVHWEEGEFLLLRPRERIENLRPLAVMRTAAIVVRLRRRVLHFATIRWTRG